MAHEKRWNPWLLLAVGALLMLYFGGLGAIPYFEPDEGRYTEIPREMLARRDFILPHLNGVLYFEKPPLYYWLNALSISVFGVGEFASRFWSALLGLLGLVPTFYLGARAGGRRAGWLSAIILGTSPLYLALAHLTIIDMTLTFFFTSTLACFYLACETPQDRTPRWLWYGVFAGAACTVLAKGLIGVVLPGGIMFLYLLAGRGWSALRRVPWVSGSALFLLLAVPWHVLAALRNPDFLWFYFVREHFLRYLTTVHSRTEPWWFFIPVVLWALLPWTALLPASLWSLLAPSALKEKLFKVPSPAMFLWVWAGVVVVFFSLSHSKLIPYILPALPPLAVLAALQLDALLERLGPEPRAIRPLFLSGLLLMAIFGFAFIWAGLGRVKAFAPAAGYSTPVVVAGASCLALALAAAVLCAVGSWRRAVPVLALCAAVSFGCIWSAGPVIASGRSVEGFARYITDHAAKDDPVFSFGFYPQALPVYLGRPIGVAAFQGELEFGISRLTPQERLARFPKAEEFASLWNSPARVWCVVDRDSLRKMDEAGLTKPVILMEAPVVLLTTNHPLSPAS